MRVLPVLGLFALVLGCSHVEVLESTTGKEEGLHFYRPEPYLLVTMTDKGSHVQVISLPNRKDRWIVRPWVGLGSVDMNVVLADGWNLTSLGAKADPKIPETITALTAVLKELAVVAESPMTPSLAPGLYRVVFDETGSVSALKRVQIATD